MQSADAFMARVASGACTVDALVSHQWKMRTMLIAAAIEGDLGLMTRLLNANADPNIVTSSDESVLIAIVQRWGSNADLLQKVLSVLDKETAACFTINWDIRTSRSMNAIHVAQSMGNISAVHILVSYGVPRAASTASGMTTEFYGQMMHAATHFS